MATRYSASFFAPKAPVEALVLRTHRVLERHGLTVDRKPSVWVDDQDADDAIPEYVATSVEDAARYLSTWPYTGSLDYTIREPAKDPDRSSTGYVVHVFYTPDGELSVLGLSFIGDAFKADRYPDTLPLITTLIEALHEEFSAHRSGLDWGLSDDVLDDEEALALSGGLATPRPWQWLDIIASALVTPYVLESYQAEAKIGSVLRRTANGSLFWQRDAGPP